MSSVLLKCFLCLFAYSDQAGIVPTVLRVECVVLNVSFVCLCALIKLGLFLLCYVLSVLF